VPVVLVPVVLVPAVPLAEGGAAGDPAAGDRAGSLAGIASPTQAASPSRRAHRARPGRRVPSATTRPGRRDLSATTRPGRRDLSAMTSPALLLRRAGPAGHVDSRPAAPATPAAGPAQRGRPPRR
jgi:hypothetical protein